MTNEALKAMAEAALDVAKPRWREIERKAKAALVRDVKAAIKTLHRLLKPKGVLLATIPLISQISRKLCCLFSKFSLCLAPLRQSLCKNQPIIHIG